MLKRVLKSGALYFLILIAVLWIAQGLFSGDTTTPEELNLTEFLDHVDNGNVETADVLDRDKLIRGELNNGDSYEVAFPRDYDGLTDRLSEAGIDMTVLPQNQSTFVTVLISILPFVLIIAIWIFIMQQMQGGGNKIMQFGKSKAKRMTKDTPKVTFNDVAGVDEAVEELNEIKEFLTSPTKFQEMGARIPKGVLLFGPPGSGKTLLARAVAGEAGVPFFSIAGSDFVEMFVGVGASRVRDLFEQAKAAAPSIIFMDEIDAVGRQRGAGLGGGHDEREQTLNQLLVEMDGFDVKDNVIMIAATNRPDILDPALLRPGRFDRQITVDSPDLDGRKAILDVHLRGKPLAIDVSAEILAKRTPGFTGADLANLVNEAALLSARHDKKEIDMNEMEESIDRVMAGPERKNRLISDEERKIIAYHEVGHALVGHILPNTDPIHKISIIPRGRALGYTLSLPAQDKYLVAKAEMQDNMAMYLGGRVAEETVFGDMTTGAQDDLEKATKMARKMVCEYGMSEKLGPLTLGHKQEQVFLGRDFASQPDYSEEIAFEIDKEIRRLVDEAYGKAQKIITENRSRLDRISEVLMEFETVDKDELISLLDSGELSAESLEKRAKRAKELEAIEAAKKARDEAAAEERAKAEAEAEAEAAKLDGGADKKGAKNGDGKVDDPPTPIK